MRKTLIISLVFAVGMLGIAACGGESVGVPGDGDGEVQQAVDNSVEGFGNLITNIDLTDPDICSLQGMSAVCQCSGGGSITFSGFSIATAVGKSTVTASVSNCIDDGTDLTYNGTMEFDEDTGDVTMNFSQFGECTNATGSGTIPIDDGYDPGCNGTITATCANETFTCTVTPVEGDDCTCI